MTRTRKLDITQMADDLRAGIADHDETITRLTAEKARHEEAFAAATAAIAAATEERANLATLLEHAERMLPERIDWAEEQPSEPRRSRNADHAAVLRWLHAHPHDAATAATFFGDLVRSGSDITERQVSRSLTYLYHHGVVQKSGRAVYYYDPDQDSGKFTLADAEPAAAEAAQPVALDAVHPAVPAIA